MCSANRTGMQEHRIAVRAFTLIELLVVVAIIGVLLGFTLIAIPKVMNGAKSAKAGTEVQRIVTAVRSFENEYGKLPQLNLARRAPAGTDVAVGDRRVGMKIANRELFDILRAQEIVVEDGPVNFRNVVYFEAGLVPNPERPAGGFLDQNKGGSETLRRCLFDPWGLQYCIALDYSGDGKMKLSYGDFAGENAPSVKVAAFSLGPDRSQGAKGNQAFRKGRGVSDDLISWW
jgi:prepilin-type N-terminal cleavage/methylation domain-containing protein